LKDTTNIFLKAVSIKNNDDNHEQKIFGKITIIWVWTLSPSIELSSNYTEGVGNLLTSSNLFCVDHIRSCGYTFFEFSFFCVGQCL